MSDTNITPEAQAILDSLASQAASSAFTGQAFTSRLAARTAARAAGCRTFSYGKRRHVAMAADGRLFYLGGSEDAATWVPMTEITVVPQAEQPEA